MTTFPRYIQDKPNGIDKFDGASQETLSDAIVKYIKENDSREKKEALPRIIGIDGSWGSGKSNVVKMVERKLSISKYYFFEYDAWGNQEDLQRRSLLEKLTDELTQNEVLTGKPSLRLRGDVVNGKTWSEVLKLLLSHKKEKTTHTTPQLSGGIVFAAYAIVVSPIITAIAYSLKDTDPTWMRILLSATPLIVGIFIWIYCVFKSFNDWEREEYKGLCGKLRKLKKLKTWGGDCKYLKFSYLTSIYTEADTTTHDYEVISEDEPTVVDFKRWMEQISKSLNTKKYEKIIIVFDNMDRLPAEKVKQLWSSIHTFFAETGFDNIWVIIPYDESHLACAFGDNGDAKKLTRYFIEKTFPVTFSVSAPVITDYRGIFDKLFTEAFGDTQKGEQETINRLYRLSHKKPNIREIIIFINKLVSTYSTTVEGLRLRNMAIYILHKDDIEHDDKRSASEVILSGDYLGDASNFIENNSDFKAEIAALTYGIDKHRASQIPMTEYIETCLDKTEGYDINKFSSDENFLIILKEICGNIDSAKLSKSIEVLNDLNVQNASIDQIWQELCSRQLKENISKLSFDKVYHILLSHVSDDQKRNITEVLCTQWLNVDNFKSSNYILCVKELAECFHGIQNLPLKEKRVEAEAYVEAVSIALDEIDKYCLSCDMNDVDTYLAKDVSNKFASYDVIKFLHQTKNYQFPLLCSAIQEAIKGRKLTSKNVGQLCRTYRLLSDADNHVFEFDKVSAQKIINDLNANNSTSIEDGYADMVAYALSQDKTQPIKEDARRDVASIIGWYAEEDKIIIDSAASPTLDMAKVAKIIIQEQNPRLKSIKSILVHYDEIKRNHKVTGKELLVYISKSDYLDELNNIANNHIEFKNCISKYLIDDAKNESSDFCKQIQQLAIKMIVNLADAKKLKSWLGVNYVLDYWNSILNSLLGTDYVKPAEGIIKDLASLLIADVPDNYVKMKSCEYAKRIMEFPSPKSLISTYKDVVNQYCNGEKKITVNSFELLEKGLRVSGAYKERVDSCLCKIITPVLSNQKSKDLILDNAKDYRKIIKQANDIQDFEKALRNAWGDEDASKILPNKS